MPCHLSGLGQGQMITANKELVSDESLCAIRIVTLSLLMVRNRSDYLTEWFVDDFLGDKVFTIIHPLLVTFTAEHMVK